jgi:dTDP-4-dehydrorhamnose reductase
VLLRDRPRWVINAAAYTRVDAAEATPSAAFAVNAAAVGALGAICARTGTRVLHFSTDYIFDGQATRPYRENDPPGPCNVYGASKLAGEHLLLTSGAQALLIRTSWLFGASGRSFPRMMWERAIAGQPVRVITDQHGCPTYTTDLAAAAWALIAQEREGIYHVANRSEATWYEVAEQVFAAAAATGLVSPCTTADYPSPATRPKYTVLDTAKVAREAGIILPTWQDGLARFLTVLQSERLAQSKA